MKVELDLPDWVSERTLYIMAGVENVAFKSPHSDHWMVKTERCNMCGKCCLNLKGGQYPLDKDGNCVNLQYDGDKIVCRLGAMRPFPCVEGDPVRNEWPDAEQWCSIRWKNS